MPFRAKYPGTCQNCGGKIMPGQYINWSRRKRGKMSHLDCAALDMVPAAPTPEPERALRALAAAIAPCLPAPSPSITQDDIEGMIDAALAQRLDRVQRVEIVTPTGAAKTQPTDHVAMAQLLYLIARRHHVYLYGPPGSGKSTAAQMAADRMGVPFGYISLNPQTPDSRLLGYMDANRNYHETVFFQRFKDGGIFCIDEVDNASPALLTTLNSALENGHAAFPCGMVPRHKDFVCVATGNTAGRGANPLFPDRRPFDAAFAERFTFLAWDYDTKLEKRVTNAINASAIARQWREWVVAVRETCRKDYPRVLATPRASFRGAEYLLDNMLTVEQIADALVFRGIDSETRNAILARHPLPQAR